MVVQVRVMPKEEAEQGFALLKNIVDIIKNPKAIDEAYEAMRKSAELTENEIEMSNKARIVIKKAEDDREEIRLKTESLEAAKQEHNNNVLSYNTNVQAENARLSGWEDRLNNIVEQNALSERKILEERLILNNERNCFLEEKNSHAVEWDKKKTDLEDANKFITKETERLSTWEKKLRAKANRLAVEAQSDD